MSRRIKQGEIELTDENNTIKNFQAKRKQNDEKGCRMSVHECSSWIGSKQRLSNFWHHLSAHHF